MLFRGISGSDPSACFRVCQAPTLPRTDSRAAHSRPSHTFRLLTLLPVLGDEDMWSPLRSAWIGEAGTREVSALGQSQLDLSAREQPRFDSSCSCNSLTLIDDMCVTRTTAAVRSRARVFLGKHAHQHDVPPYAGKKVPTFCTAFIFFVQVQVGAGLWRQQVHTFCLHHTYAI